LRLITMTVADLCGRIGRRLAIAVTIGADPTLSTRPAGSRWPTPGHFS